MKCYHCEKEAMYRCGVCGHFLCPEHITLKVSCGEHVNKKLTRYSIRKTRPCDIQEIRKIVIDSFGEVEQLSHDQTFSVSTLSGYIAETEKEIAGFVTFVEKIRDVLIVALAVLPEYQLSGIGKALVNKVENAARRMKKMWLTVSTSNDDLPALAFYQSIGFQIYDVRPDVVADKHGRVIKGIAGLPIRDELRLRKTLVNNK